LDNEEDRPGIFDDLLGIENKSRPETRGPGAFAQDLRSSRIAEQYAGAIAPLRRLDPISELPVPTLGDTAAMIRWAELPIEQRTEDLCPRCGLHMIPSIAVRIEWLRHGGTARCTGCGSHKTLPVVR